MDDGRVDDGRVDDGSVVRVGAARTTSEGPRTDPRALAPCRLTKQVVCRQVQFGAAAVVVAPVDVVAGRGFSSRSASSPKPRPKAAHIAT